jgi:hypothetical protein
VSLERDVAEALGRKSRRRQRDRRLGPREHASESDSARWRVMSSGWGGSIAKGTCWKALWCTPH